MTTPDAQPNERYESLWQSALPRIRDGAIDIDPLLARRVPDARRGLTLIFRPSGPVQERVLKFVGQLRVIEPEQHYATSADLHMTVLSLFTVTERPELFQPRLASYLEAAADAIEGATSFEIDFRGITLSPGAVLVQGFPRSCALEKLRESLRAALHAGGLAQGLDTRYRLITAHLTIARFRAPFRDSARFADLLERSREFSFGVSQVTTLSLVENDWFMSADSLELLRNYALALPSGRETALGD